MTPKQALSNLRKARTLDLKATDYALKATRARANHGTYSGHDARCEKFANEAAALFLQVERFLESQ